MHSRKRSGSGFNSFFHYHMQDKGHLGYLLYAPQKESRVVEAAHLDVKLGHPLFPLQLVGDDSLGCLERVEYRGGLHGPTHNVVRISPPGAFDHFAFKKR